MKATGAVTRRHPSVSS